MPVETVSVKSITSIGSITVPEVLLLISSKNFAVVTDEVSHIHQSLILGIWVEKLNNRSWDNADLKLLGQDTIFVQIFFPLSTLCLELWIIRNPVR